MKKGPGDPQKWSEIAPPSVLLPEALYDFQIVERAAFSSRGNLLLQGNSYLKSTLRLLLRRRVWGQICYLKNPLLKTTHSIFPIDQESTENLWKQNPVNWTSKVINESKERRIREAQLSPGKRFPQGQV